MRVLLLVIIASTVLIGACTSPQPTPEPISSPQATATLTSVSSPPETPAPVELTLWLPDWMLLDDPANSETLQATIHQFEAAHDVSVKLVIKSPSGPNGLLDALAKTYPVAPTLLPDLIALPFRDAETAWQRDLLQPLDALISPELSSDLYPFAQTVARSDQGWFAVPLIAGFEHLAFQLTGLSEPPLDWNVIIESGAPYAFPAGGNEAALSDALLIHYLSAVGPTGDIDRNEDALLQQLSFYEMLAGLSLVDASTTQASNAAETWQRILDGDVAMAHTSTKLWLSDHAQVNTLRFGPIPTADSTPRYLVYGWALAIITPDPTRQALAAALLNDLANPTNLAEWSLSVHYLPARRAALALWPEDAYRAFVSEALEKAERPPALREDAAFVRALHRAALDVLTGVADAATATKSAVAAW